jgi:hypothetical protein
MVLLGLLFVAAAGIIAARVPEYQQQAARLDRGMTEQEKQTRDGILNSTVKRSELALALLQRELRMKELQQKGLHIAVDTQDSVLFLRHDNATLRRVPVRIGPDSTVTASDGRTWRMVRALGERHVEDKETDGIFATPEWIYVARGEAVPSREKRVDAGALGKYTLLLDDGTAIYTPPSGGPFTASVKPAAFLVAEADMQPIFDAVGKDTPVFIY